MILRAEKLSSIGTLAAGAAHEILNPAGVIQLHAEMIELDAMESEADKKSASMIIRNVQRIKKICDDLRRFSRDETPKTIPFDPNKSLFSSLELIEPKLTQAGVEKQIKTYGIPFIIQGDTEQIQQVLVILLNNALDAMPTGGNLTISSQIVELNGWRHWKLAISDTGIGISEDILPQVFDPFFTTKSPEKGTGLGLSVLHGIVETHEGEISVESEVNVGTTFTLLLPEAGNESAVV